MQIGIRDGCLRQPTLEAIATAGELGFDGIEICIGQDESSNILWARDGADQVNDACEQHGVVISSLSPGYFASLHPVVDDPDLREAGKVLIHQCVNRCEPVGAKAILVPMFPKDMGDWSDQKWQQLIDGFKPLAEGAEHAGVILALESTFSADQLERIIDGVDCPALTVYYDTANTTNLGYHSPTEIRKLNEKIGMVHVKDTDGNHLGEGRVPFDDCKLALADIDYDGWFVLETPAGDDAEEAGKKNLAFTQSWLADYVP